MRAVLWLLAAGSLGYGVSSGPTDPDRHVLLVVGGTDGYLAPCGCVKPMSGGIKRRITALRQMSVEGRTTVIDNGGLVVGTARQDEMKAEALAESMRLVGVAALNYGVEEARLGAGMADSISRLSDGALVATGVGGTPLPVNRFRVSGPFVIGSIDPRTDEMGALLRSSVEGVDASVRALLAEAKDAGLAPVLMSRGGIEESRALAKRHPELRLIVCRVATTPFATPERVGDTWIVTPGERGKYVVKLEWDGDGFVAYSSVDLGPEHKDDEKAQAIYSAYLARVGHEGLLAMVPRSETAAFAGNKACLPCHSAAARVWRSSAHGRALSTLETEGHDKDPDCVSCHVVGLSSVHGFVSRAETPSLTDVGCEACHGPGRAHAMSPTREKMPKVGREACMTCHNASHSPGFDFEEYWPSIAH